MNHLLNRKSNNQYWVILPAEKRSRTHSLKNGIDILLTPFLDFQVNNFSF